jgi:hypothetical protein
VLDQGAFAGLPLESDSSVTRKAHPTAAISIVIVTAVVLCSLLVRARQRKGGYRMATVWTGIVVVVAVVASILLAAPVIESGTSGSTQVFQAVGTADGGSD